MRERVPEVGGGVSLHQRVRKGLSVVTKLGLTPQRWTVPTERTVDRLFR